MRHAKEPWSYQASIPEEGYECFWINGADHQISSFDGPQSEEQFANVRRVIACVNACEGVSTEELEKSGFISGLLEQVECSNITEKNMEGRLNIATVKLAATEKRNTATMSAD